MKNFDSLISALKKANAPMVYGFGGISMEEQRLAVRLAKKMGAMAAAERLLLPSLTVAALSGCTLILTAGGELPFEVSDARVMKDERLLDIGAWRALASLFRGNKLPGAEEYLSLYEELKKEEHAALVLVTDSVDETLRRAITRFATEAHRIEIMQISSVENALGAYEVMLEEAGGACAWFGGGEVHLGSGYGFESLACGGCDLLLRIGEGRELSSCGVPRYAIAASAREGECLIEAASAGGIAMRYDGVPVNMEAVSSGEYSILSLLTRLTEEVEA